MPYPGNSVPSDAAFPGADVVAVRSTGFHPGKGPTKARFYQSPRATVPPLPFIPAPVEPAGFRPRWFPLPRRGWFCAVPPSLVVVPGAIDQAGLRSRGLSVARRGRFLPVAVAVAPPPGFTDQAGARPRLAPPPRRGTFQPLPAAIPALLGGPDMSGPRPRAVSLPRRSRFSLVVPPQVGPGEGPLVLGVVRQFGWHPRWAPAIRRGQFLVFPLPQIGPGEGALAPTVRRQVQRLGFVVRRGVFQPTTAPVVASLALVRRARGVSASTRRGAFQTLALPALGYSPVAPAVTRTRRAVALLVRRGQYQAPVNLVSLPAAPIRAAGRRAVMTPRRGLVRPRPWFEPPGPQVLPPVFVRQTGFRPRWFPLPRRGQFSSALLVGLAPPPVVAVPAVITRRRLPVTQARRGAFQPIALGDVTPTGQQSRSRVRLTSSRCGSFQALPLPTLGYSPAVAAIINPVRHYAGLPVRRGSALRVLPSLGYGPVVPARVVPARRYVGISVGRGAFQVLAQILSPAPQLLRRSRATGIAIRRGTFQSLPAPSLGYGPLVAVRTAPARRLLGLPVRRGAVLPRPWFEPPGPQALVPPFVHHGGSRPKWGPLPRRAQFSSSLLVGLAPPPPPVGNIVRDRPRVAVARRGQFFAIPQAAPGVSTTFVRRVRVGASIRRGTFLAVVPTPRITPWVPAPIQARRAPAVTLRRGTFQSTPAVALIVLRLPRRTRAVLWVRRGQFQVVPAVTQVPPGIIRPVTPRISAGRRGRISTPLSAPATPPRWYRCARPTPGTPRRQFGSPPWTKPAGPGPLCPSVIRATRRYAGLPFKRGRWIQGVVPPQVTFPGPVAATIGTTVPLAIATIGTTVPLAIATIGTTVPLAIAGPGKS